ncbi:MAG: SMP-30/gluconolactonase/LRE family protein [Cyclobacteriaceae bacterium]
MLANGKIEVLDDRLKEIIDTNAKIEVIADGHEWTEGPLWVDSEQMLLYSDIPRNAIYQWKEGQKAAVYLQPAGFLGENFEGSEPGSNGLLLNSDGQLVLCQHGERRMAVMTASLNDPKPDFVALASDWEGKRFNSPNDAAYMSNGNLYFTDPPYGLPQRMEDPEKEIDFQGVYRLSTAGEITLLTDELTRPNGVAFSPDEKTAYVANSDPKMAIWKAFDVGEEGLFTNGRLFFDATDRVPTDKGLPDGLKVDDQGNVFATGPGGVLIFSPEGELLGIIRTGEATANCAFNSDKSVLFVTADMYVLKIKIK